MDKYSNNTLLLKRMLNACIAGIIYSFYLSLDSGEREREREEEVEGGIGREDKNKGRQR